MANRQLSEEEKEALQLLKGKRKKEELEEEAGEEKEEIKEEREEVEEGVFREFFPVTKAVSPLLPIERKPSLEAEAAKVEVRKETEKEKSHPLYGEKGVEERLYEIEGKELGRERAFELERRKEITPSMFERKPIEIKDFEELQGAGKIEEALKYESVKPEPAGLPFMKKEELKKYKRR